MRGTVAILGAGDLGRQIAGYAIDDSHYDKVVFFDDFHALEKVDGHQVVGRVKDLLHHYSNGLFKELIIAIGYKHLDKKAAIYREFHGKIPFGRIVHSSVWASDSATIGEGSVIYPGCIVEAGSFIGPNVLLNIGCSVSHDSSIGAHSFLSPRVAVAGFVDIGESCMLGINSTIIDNLHLVKHTTLGAATVVINHIEKPGLYVGNPARQIK